ASSPQEATSPPCSARISRLCAAAGFEFLNRAERVGSAPLLAIKWTRQERTSRRPTDRADGGGESEGGLHADAGARSRISDTTVGRSTKRFLAKHTFRMRMSSLGRTLPLGSPASNRSHK